MKLLPIEPIPLYWWRKEPNFGDALSPWIVQQVLKSIVKWSDRSAKLVALGSVLCSARAGDVVWGTGVHPNSNERHPAWSGKGITVLAVRGPLTRDYIVNRGGVCPETYGDPAVLMPELYTPHRIAGFPKIGFIPHIYDAPGRIFCASHAPNAVIDPRSKWKDVVNKIASCEMVFSSSLHAIIIAEAYGVRATWIRCSEGELKYRDYYQGTGRQHVTPRDWADIATATPLPLPAACHHGQHPLVAALRNWQGELTNVHRSEPT